MKKAEVKPIPLPVLPLRCLFALTVLCAGGYYEAVSALLFVAECAVLLVHLKKQPVTLRLSLTVLAGMVIPAGYLLSCLWAVDPGVAPWGFVKTLPLLPWAVLLQLAGEDGRKRLLRDVPYLGALAAVLSLALQYVPAFTGFFRIAGRLAGTFSYPNAFAAFLLAGLLLLFCEEPGEEEKPLLRYLTAAALACGIGAAASRAVLGLGAVFLAAALVLRVKKTKKLPWELLLAAAAGLMLASLWYALRAGSALAGAVRGAGGSTFYGRLLYWRDALPVILKHPFGLGYLGYYITQGSFQTGVYAVRWVHNDLLQLLLDTGWLPTGFFVYVLARSVFKKSGSCGGRLALLAVLAHACFDFDLEFTAMYLLVFLLPEPGEGFRRPLMLKAAPQAVLAVLTGVFALYIGLVSTLTYTGNNAAAVRLCPFDTLAQVELLTETDDQEELFTLAETIVRRDGHIALARNALALKYLSEGDMLAYIREKEAAIACNRYDITEYEDYFTRLAAAEQIYLAAGDTGSADYCRGKLKGIEKMLETLKEETSPLAYRIADAPVFTLPEAYSAYLAG